MTDELPDVPSLRAIEPPPGGLQALRAAIDADDAKRSARRRWWMIAAPAVAVAAALLLWLRPADNVVELPVAAPVAIPDPAIAPTFYWVASTPGSAPELPRRPVTYVEPASLAVRALDLP